MSDLSNVSFSKDTISFDIVLGFIEKNGAKRTLHFEARRDCDKCEIYKAAASGFYKSLVSEKIVKVELKQIPSISLKYPIGNFN